MLAHSFGATQLSPGAYYTLTYASLAAIYLVALVIQSAYSVRGAEGGSGGRVLGSSGAGAHGRRARAVRAGGCSRAAARIARQRALLR